MKKKDLIFLLTTTFVLVLAWIAFSIYHNSVTSTIPEALGIQISPINPTFDMETFEKLKKRSRVLPLFEFKKGQSEQTATNSASATSSAQPALPPTIQSPVSSGSEQSSQGGHLLP